MTGEFPSGTVWLVGAGPGDPDLLTRKAERLIRSVSLVIHDALVGPEVLDLVPPSARRVYAGKRAGRHAMDQCAISGLIIEAALAGERVVRLKGGVVRMHGNKSNVCEFHALTRRSGESPEILSSRCRQSVIASRTPPNTPGWPTPRSGGLFFGRCGSSPGRQLRSAGQGCLPARKAG
ncbi:hypothetical protein ETX26_02005 [Pelagerythrobacter rhizovicinus]|uniref:Tetrapyrrole methylase domain-containing protein n=1 Tax=Pelagerythrobacter rhizovicinus TaxID=2268576 RepID=A0A4Q2KM56_9SPHN|nr:hypothetical protein ETX26_02005 [Pelagerythrobacter rhizovicinus]